METSNNRTLAAMTHLSTFGQYFFPFANFILPVVIWSSAKSKSALADQHGREAINFQLSVFLYTIVLMLIAIPTLLFTIFKNIAITDLMQGDDIAIENLATGDFCASVVIAAFCLLILIVLKVAEFFLVIVASVKAANGERFEYPFCIAFIKDSSSEQPLMSKDNIANADA